MSKGSRNRVSDFDAYRNNKFWERKNDTLSGKQERDLLGKEETTDSVQAHRVPVQGQREVQDSGGG